MGVRATVRDFLRYAISVEVMGSEGYLINQFLVAQTNQRNDKYGGDRFANQMRLDVEIVRDTQEVCDPDDTIIFHLNLLDLADGRSSWEEVKALALAGAGGRRRDHSQHGHRLVRNKDS